MIEHLAITISNDRHHPTALEDDFYQKTFNKNSISSHVVYARDLDNLIQILSTPHPSELDRENAVMDAVQALIAYDSRIGQVVNRVKGVHARVEELKGLEERIAIKKEEYAQLLEELYVLLYRTRDEVEEQRQIVNRLEPSQNGPVMIN